MELKLTREREVEFVGNRMISPQYDDLLKMVANMRLGDVVLVSDIKYPQVYNALRRNGMGGMYRVRRTTDGKIAISPRPKVSIDK